ncbi:MAG: SulP family inorganic anion transporter [Verrucomicrobia bacterium]|nr:SulP family inorganic anion transporter [Verrucomicrobiota bacterium]MDA1086954.1 SulP family inorganic anion transporter [Verrucomicrobiota bacterium]
MSTGTPFGNRVEVLPFIRTLRAYKREDLKADLRAGINVALLAAPQGMAYALIAGLPLRYGIYCAAVAPFLGAVFARSPFIILGPTNATSVLLLSAFGAMGLSGPEKLQLLPMLVTMSGAFLIFGAMLNVANLVQYVSRSVITGYVTAAAVLIIANQLRNVLGIELQQTSSTFVHVCAETLSHLGEMHPSALLIGTISLLVYLLLRWKLGTLPNVAITLIAMSLLARWLPTRASLQYLDAVDAGDWQVTLPRMNFGDISRVASASLAIAVLSMLEGVSVGKSLAARAGARLNVNQEVFSMGIANIGCGLLSGMPASGSPTRSALNWTSGASGPMASLFCGILCAAGVFLVGPYIAYVPKAVLAVLVICIGVSLINRRQIRIMTRTTRADALVFYTTLVSGLLFPLDVAIYLGVGTSIVLFMRQAAMPQMVEYAFDTSGQLTELGSAQARTDPEVSIVHVEGNLFFGAAELFRDQMRRVFEDPNLRVIVLKLRNAHHLDATSVAALEELVRYAEGTNCTLLVSEVRPDTMRIFDRAGLFGVLKKDRIFADVAENPTSSTAAAIRAAKGIIGSESARVSIYADERS